MSLRIEPDCVLVSYGRQYEGGPFETCCPADPGCLWRPQARTYEAVLTEIRAHVEAPHPAVTPES